MKLVQRLQLSLRSLVEDIFGEGDEAGSALAGASPERFLKGMLSEAQGHLDRLQIELASARQHRQNLRRQIQEAQAQADSLNKAVDEALSAEQEDLARSRLAQVQRLENSSKELAQLEQAWNQQVNLLEQAIQEQQTQVESARRKTQALLERENNARITEEMMQVGRDLYHRLDTIQDELRERQERIEQREDRLSARHEFKRHGKN